MTFVQANLFIEHKRTQSIGLCSTEFGSRPQLNTIQWIEFDWVRFIWLSSISSEIKLAQSSVFDFVPLPESIEFNPRIEFDFQKFDWLCRALSNNFSNVGKGKNYEIYQHRVNWTLEALLLITFPPSHIWICFLLSIAHKKHQAMYTKDAFVLTW